MTKGVQYPKVEWTREYDDDRRWDGKAEGFELSIRYQWAGRDKGFWCALVNSRAIQTGSGPHGYRFESAEAAKKAAVATMKDRIDAKVQVALNTLKAYTNYYVS